MISSPTEVFGLAAVSAMVIFYALEHKHPRYVLLFAFSCLASSGYAYLIGSYPFLIVELVWAAIALHRWSKLSY